MVSMPVNYGFCLPFFFLFLFPVPFSAEEPPRASYRLSQSLIGDDGRIYACSNNNFFAFETNGSMAWSLHLNYKCDMATAPVQGGIGKIYFIAENRVMKINLQDVATSGPVAEVLFDHGVSSEDIIGIAVSVLSSSVYINVENRGLFAYSVRGEMQWSTGPVMEQFGYRQGCPEDVKDCHFTSVPVIDQCEASIYISNTKGELYALWLRSPHFKWIRDLSTFGKHFTVIPGNCRNLYVIAPVRSLVLALDVSTGNVLWQKSIGPLSSANSSAVVDSYGWLSIGSLDGFLYSVSPTGILKQFPKSSSLDSVILVSPVLDCSGHAVYSCQTEMEGKITHERAGYTYISAMKPKAVVFTLMVPAAGKIYWSRSYPSNSDFSQLLSSLSKSDLQHFVLDEGTLLSFTVASNYGNPSPCRNEGQKLASKCSQGEIKHPSIYIGNERAILLSLLFETLLLVTFAALVNFCCLFWKKKKLKDQDLGSFLENRRSLQLKKKAFQRTITELEHKAADEEAADNELIEKLGDLVREREGIERKLSSTYSLGRDRRGTILRSKSLLPLYDGRRRAKSFSFKKENKASLTIFHTLSDTSSASSESSSEEAAEDAKGKGKAVVEEGSESCSSEDDEVQLEGFSDSETSSSSGQVHVGNMFSEQDRFQVHEGNMFSEQDRFLDGGGLLESMPSTSRSMWLKRRRTLSSTN